MLFRPGGQCKDTFRAFLIGLLSALMFQVKSANVVMNVFLVWLIRKSSAHSIYVVSLMALSHFGLYDWCFTLSGIFERGFCSVNGSTQRFLPMVIWGEMRGGKTSLRAFFYCQHEWTHKSWCSKVNMVCALASTFEGHLTCSTLLVFERAIFRSALGAKELPILSRLIRTGVRTMRSPQVYLAEPRCEEVRGYDISCNVGAYSVLM